MAVEVEQWLAAVGRAPLVVDMALEQAGDEYDPEQVIKVHDQLQISSKRIHAVGECCTV